MALRRLLLDRVPPNPTVFALLGLSLLLLEVALSDPQEVGLDVEVRDTVGDSVGVRLPETLGVSETDRVGASVEVPLGEREGEREAPAATAYIIPHNIMRMRTYTCSA
jgi:hypothetical protein